LVTVHRVEAEEALDGARLGQWAEGAVRAAARQGFRRICLVLPRHEAASEAAGAVEIQRRVRLAGYHFGRQSSKAPHTVEVVELLADAASAARHRRQADTARILAEAGAAARELADTPPNEADPEWMTGRARKLAESRGLKIRVLGQAQLRKRGMGGILAVGGGSERPPRLVRLEWGSGKETIAIVGKGVTFDTGGISIKPAAAMDEMKYDKSGACVALGIAQGAADLDLPFRFRVYLPLAENMPSGSAYRPGDIVRCYNGKTVEILNTDAEGRMILADALAWAAADKPDVLIDYATLTGACVVALGHHGAGLFSPDDALADELLSAGRGTGERLWRLPLWPEFVRDMKGRHADLRNSGSRWGGASTAAAFLSEFVEGAGRWAHLDIAGTAWVGGDQPGTFGSTAYGVALTLTWLLRRAGRLTPSA
jgi:leucyl aminopeptidase